MSTFSIVLIFFISHIICCTPFHFSSFSCIVSTSKFPTPSKCRTSCLSMTSTQTFGAVEYRNARPEEIQVVAELLTSSFDSTTIAAVNPPPTGIIGSMLQWLFKRSFEDDSTARFESQLQQRFEAMSLGRQHAMLVAVVDSEVVGFAEVGMLPRPVTSSRMIVETSDPSIPAPPSDQQSTGDIGHGSTIQQAINDAEMTLQGAKSQTQSRTLADVPFVGNVAVSSQYRRRGIASKLMKIATAVARKWRCEELFVAVECDNNGAQALYANIGFEVMLDERDNLLRTSKNLPRLFMRRMVPPLVPATPTAVSVDNTTTGSIMGADNSSATDSSNSNDVISLNTSDSIGA